MPGGLPSILAKLPELDSGVEPDGSLGQGGPTLADLAALQQRLGYEFANTSLLRVAMTAGSWTNENQDSGWPSNACLEFFGDAVLGLMAADALWRQFPSSDEGMLTRLRASVVSKRSLAPAARKFDLGNCLLIGRGDGQRGGRGRDGTLADALEAVLGAIFLDAREAGLDPAAVTAEVFRRVFGEQLGSLTLKDGIDSKSRLQHVVQREYRRTPRYIQVGDPPPPTEPHWIVRVQVETEAGAVVVLGEGEGRSVKIAERRAAEVALTRVDKNDG